MPTRQTNTENAAAAAASASAAAAAAANAAAATVHSFSEISSKLDAGLGGLHERFNQLDKAFAVHEAHAEQEDARLTELETIINGENGIAMKVQTMWTIDRAKLWAIRVLVGTALTVIATAFGYWLKSLMKWL